MEQNPFIDQLAAKIQKLGLTTLAILLLETHKPLAFIASQLLLIAQPTFDLFVPSRFTQNSIDLLADSSQLEQLLTKLEVPPSKESML